MYKTLRESFQAKADAIVDLLCKKRADYGTSSILETPLTRIFCMYPESMCIAAGVLNRLSDKFKRLENILGNEDNIANESIDDTLNDIIGYALIMKSLRDNTFTLPLEENK